MNDEFANKTVIVTGASRGLGKGIAKAFGARGANVLVVARGEDAGRRVAADIEAAGGSAAFVRADVSRRADVAAMVAEAVERYRGLHVLCVNAGIFPSSPIETMSDGEWDEVHNVNVKSMFLAVQLCLPHMKAERYGRIVLTSSITGPITGFSGWAHYGASKAAMLGFMRSAAIECAPHNITINAILPGNIMTEGMASVGAEYIRKMEQAIPMGRLGEPDDIGHAALFLASAGAKFITGQTLVVDGGQTLPEA